MIPILGFAAWMFSQCYWGCLSQRIRRWRQAHVNRRRSSSRSGAWPSPIPAVHGVVRWRLIDLAQWIFEEFRITVANADGVNGAGHARGSRLHA